MTTPVRDDTRKLTYRVVENGIYERDIEIPDDLDVDDEDAVTELLEADWTDSGHPINDFKAVEDRSFSWGD
jgi:hypothetical protein